MFGLYINLFQTEFISSKIYYKRDDFDLTK